MAFNDTFRLSSHAVIFNQSNEVLMLKATYGDCSWGLPGGALEPGETIHEALKRECIEELGIEISSPLLTGVYFHKHYNSHAFIFHCTIEDTKKIKLSEEHSEWRYFSVNHLSTVQSTRINDCLNYINSVVSRKF